MNKLAVAILILTFIPIVLADNNSINITSKINTTPCIEGIKWVCNNGEEVWTYECFDGKYLSTGMDCVNGTPGVIDRTENIKYKFVSDDWKKTVIGIISILLLLGIIYLVYRQI